MRLAAYEDAIYRRDGDVLTCARAFPLFMWGLADDVESLTVLGRLDPEPGRSHYVLTDAGVEFVALPHYASLADPRAVLGALGGTLRRFWEVLGRVDAIWVCGPQPVAVLVVLLALLRRRRVVLGVRQNTLEYARNRFSGARLPMVAFRALEAAWRALARVVPVAVVGPELRELYARAPRVHEMAVSFVSDRDIIAPRASGTPGGPTTLLSVGRLEAEKNPLLLADTLEALQAGGGDWRLRIVGEGPLEGELRARVRELGLEDRVDFLGYVPLDGGLLDLYRSSDLFLHVSWTEGLPQVLLEAFAARLPVVATDVGGVGAVARGAGLLVEAGDAAAAAAAVRRLAGDAELAARFVAEGVARARERSGEAERRRLAEFIQGPPGESARAA